jgi:hypothetical protein
MDEDVLGCGFGKGLGSNGLLCFCAVTLIKKENFCTMTG